MAEKPVHMPIMSQWDRHDNQGIKIKIQNSFRITTDTTEKTIRKTCTDKKRKRRLYNTFTIAEQHLHETGYLTKRGISVETQRKFHCGYTSNFIYKNNQTTSEVIIPTSNTSYIM